MSFSSDQASELVLLRGLIMDYEYESGLGQVLILTIQVLDIFLRHTSFIFRILK